MRRWSWQRCSVLLAMLEMGVYGSPCGAQQTGAHAVQVRSGSSSHPVTKAVSLRQALAAAVVAEERKGESPSGQNAGASDSAYKDIVYFVVKFGANRYEYRRKDWLLIAKKESRGNGGSGIVAGWAEVGVDMLDKARQSRVQGAGWLFHYRQGKWQRVACNEGPGYDRAKLHRLGMTDAQIKRLKLDLDE